ncbi:hypothetical protein B1T48_18040 [Mycobacterium persicum]|nr:hypothetical protein B1T48_18040 [Mycobacterium persicum]
MSFVIAAPDPMLAAAGGLIEIGSAISTANATAAAPTTSLLAAAGDEVSAAIATLFNTYAEEYQQFSTQASAFHDHFVRTLQAGMSSYASAETTNAAQQLLNVFNAPARALLGRPLIGRGTDGVAGTGQAGEAGGLLFGNGGNSRSHAARGNVHSGAPASFQASSQASDPARPVSFPGATRAPAASNHAGPAAGWTGVGPKRSVRGGPSGGNQVTQPCP